MKKNRLLEYAMFYGASPKTFDNAKRLRENMTEAEEKLWSVIRMKQLNGLQFRRQHPLNIFIADFYCSKVKLVIEVDGDVHNLKKQEERDEGRDNYMKEKGITVLRFTNDDVIKDIKNVILKIRIETNNLLKNSSNETV